MIEEIIIIPMIDDYLPDTVWVDIRENYEYKGEPATSLSGIQMTIEEAKEFNKKLEEVLNEWQKNKKY